jgi:uncharacterized protein
METALITGASSGIGYELAKLFAKDNYNLVLVSRDEKKLEGLKKEFTKKGVKVTVIRKDLSEKKAPEEIYSELKNKKIEVDILVNNAGFGGRGFFHERPLKEDEDMMQVNMIALTNMTKLFLAPMVKRRKGRILNIASVAAFLPGPLMAVYYASKSYVLSFSEALANEVKDKGIIVTVLCPGPTKTKFFERSNINESAYLRKSMMDADKVALIGYKGLMEGKTVVIPGFLNNIQVFFMRFLPRPFLAKVARRLV